MTVMDEGINHPADQLALCRQRIKVLQAQEAELKAACLALGPEDRIGQYNEVRVTEVVRSTIDTKALTEAMGTEVLFPFTRKTESVTLTLREIR